MTGLDLTAFLREADFVYAYIGEDPCATEAKLPPSVVRLFTEQVPALVAEVRRLKQENADQAALIDMLSAEIVERANTGGGS